MGKMRGGGHGNWGCDARESDLTDVDGPGRDKEWEIDIMRWR